MASLNDNHGVSVRELVSHIEKPGIVVPIVTQAELLGISRTSVYYQPRPVDQFTLSIMHKIDEVYTESPFYGVRKITAQLRRDGLAINHKRIHRLMRKMGLEAIYPKPNLSQNTQAHPVYPYLLKDMVITHPNQVWGTDITYIRLKQGFLCLVAFMDWFSRFILSWKLSISLSVDFCIEAAKEALTKAVPEITNQDQGVQFTSAEYLSVWDPDKTRISMDGRGRCMDNIFNERFWRSLKYEDIYLKNYEAVPEAKQGIGDYIDFYNFRRLHQSQGYKTPAEIYFGGR